MLIKRFWLTIMMMLRQDKKKKKVKKAAVLIVIAGVVYMLFASPISSPIVGYLHQAVSPVWKIYTIAEEKLEPLLSYFSSRRSLYIENKELKEQLSIIGARLADRSFLYNENLTLKEKLGRYAEDPERILAIVLAKPDRTPYDTLVIDVGKKNGVSAGNIIMIENVVLGEVAEVYQASSKVRLYSSYGEQVTVFIGNEAIMAEAKGLGGGNFEIELPQNVDVFIGDSVYISEFDPRILGVVEYINADANDAFEKILFRSPVSLFSLRFVDVAPPSYDE